MKSHLDLLLAAGSPDEPLARVAWYRWREENPDLQVVDHAAISLLPAVYVRLKEWGIVDSEMPRLTGVNRYNWLRNHTHERICGGLIELLATEKIQSMVLKGSALLPHYYKDYGARSMEDVDVLIRAEDFGRAMVLLQKSGWQPTMNSRAFDTRFGHALAFKKTQGGVLPLGQVDLHAHVLIQSCEAGADNVFWQGAVEGEVGGRKCLRLCATDQLLHICAHGFGWSWDQQPGVRWLIDAVTVWNEASEEIDWVRFVRVAKQRGVSHKVGAALALLEEIFKVEIPQSVILELVNERLALSDRWRNRVEMRDFQSNPFWVLVLCCCTYMKGVSSYNPIDWTSGLLAYLKVIGEVENAWAIPSRLAKKMIGFTYRVLLK